MAVKDLLDFSSASPGHQLPDIEWQRRFIVDDRPIAAAFGRTLSDRLADLVDIAMAVYVADRLRPRRPDPRSDPFRLRWSRALCLRLPVREPDLWRSPTVLSHLEALLGWLTDDSWEFDFVQRVTPRRLSQTQAFLFEAPLQEPIDVGLLSGGLDSLVGAAQVLSNGNPGTVVLVSASSSTRLRHLQGQLVRELRARPGSRDVVSIRVPFNLIDSSNGVQEISQRSRGFVFLVLGAAAAITAGRRELRLFENGIGSINLPFVECQVGTHSTRSAHPATLNGFSELMRAVEEPLTIHNPLFWLTKAEVCSSLPEPYRPLGAIAESCDGFPQRVAKTPRCGRCTACVLRAMSLEVAGMSSVEDWTKYRIQPLASVRLTRSADGVAGAMLYQVERLRTCLRAPEPWNAMVRAFPSLARVPSDLDTGPLGQLIARSDLEGLFRRYVADWDCLTELMGAAT